MIYLRWGVLLISMLALAGCNVRPFSYFFPDNNQTPEPSASAIVTNENTPGTTQVEPNDSDTDRHIFAIVAGQGPTNGTAVVDPNGLVTYTPNLNFFGDS